MALCRDDDHGVFQDPKAASAIDSFINILPPNSKTLLLGTENTLPLAKRLATNRKQQNIQIHAIDSNESSLANFQDDSIPAYTVKTNIPEYILPPQQQNFAAIIALFSLSQFTRAQTYTQLFKVSEWLAPNGHFLLATTLLDTVLASETEIETKIHPHDRLDNDCIRAYPLTILGKRHPHCTLFSHKSWVDMCTKAGLSLESSTGIALPSGTGGNGTHHLLLLRKAVDYALMGPYPSPTSYRGPHRLSEAAWGPFAERLVRDEFGFVLDVLRDNVKVLDVGSGYGKLPQELAAQTGKAYSIEPNPDRNAVQQAQKGTSNGTVEIARGTAENIPYPDSTFDAVVAMWVMHYVDDLTKSLTEMARVADRTDPRAKLIIVQGTPDNEVIDLMNSVCAPLSAHNKRANHQGFLLQRAMEVFTECGFADASVHRVEAFCEFKEAVFEERVEKAARVVAGLWCLEDERFEEMKEAVARRLRFSFREREFAIGDQVAVLVARPGAASN